MSWGQARPLGGGKVNEGREAEARRGEGGGARISMQMEKFSYSGIGDRLGQRKLRDPRGRIRTVGAEREQLSGHGLGLMKRRDARRGNAMFRRTPSTA